MGQGILDWLDNFVLPAIVGFVYYIYPVDALLWASLMYIGRDHWKEVVWLDITLERNVVRGTVQICIFERSEPAPLSSIGQLLSPLSMSCTINVCESRASYRAMSKHVSMLWTRSASVS